MTTIECDAMADIIAEAIKMAIAPMKKQIAELKSDRDIDRAQIAELKARPTMKEYRFTWRPEERYAKGETVTHGGSMWYTTRDSEGMRPGESSAWVMSVKCGRDGKDAR